MTRLSDNASIRFGGLVHAAIVAVREDIAALQDPRSKDPWLPGSLRALRVLFETNLCRSQRIATAELESWLAIVEAWRAKKRKHDPAWASIEPDLQALRAYTAKLPERTWQAQARQRRIVLVLPDQQLVDAAEAAAERAYPVELGNALHVHLEGVVRQLAEG